MKMAAAIALCLASLGAQARTVDLYGPQANLGISSFTCRLSDWSNADILNLKSAARLRVLFAGESFVESKELCEQLQADTVLKNNGTATLRLELSETTPLTVLNYEVLSL